MTIGAELQRVSEILADWTDTPVRSTGGGDFIPPKRTGSPTSPAGWLVYEVTHDSSELLAFGGETARHGRLLIGYFVEPAAREVHARSVLTDVAALFATADVPELVFLGGRLVRSGLPVKIDEEEWATWVWEIPFIAQD